MKTFNYYAVSLHSIRFGKFTSFLNQKTIVKNAEIMEFWQKNYKT